MKNSAQLSRTTSRLGNLCVFCVLGGSLVLLVSVGANESFAQTWPSKPLRVVVVDTPYQNVARTLQAAETKERLDKLGAEPMLMTPSEFDAHIRREISSNAALVKAAGVTAN